MVISLLTWIISCLLRCNILSTVVFFLSLVFCTCTITFSPCLLSINYLLARRGAIVTTFIVCYALTSFISGYVSGGLYSRNGGMIPLKRSFSFIWNMYFFSSIMWPEIKKLPLCHCRLRQKKRISKKISLYLFHCRVMPLNSVSGSLSGKSWIKAMILAASLFPFLCFGIGFMLNTIAIFYGSLAAIPFGTMVVVFILWAFISFPLTLLGTVVGRNWSGAPNNPCRVKTIPRPIPEKKWYLTPSVVSLMGGLLPFGSIFIEMYFVFTSFWNYKVN